MVQGRLRSMPVLSVISEFLLSLQRTTVSWLLLFYLVTSFKRVCGCLQAKGKTSCPSFAWHSYDLCAKKLAGVIQNRTGTALVRERKKTASFTLNTI